MRYFLGVDVGGTKTHALIADEYGNALGFGMDGQEIADRLVLMACEKLLARPFGKP